MNDMGAPKELSALDRAVATRIRMLAAQANLKQSALAALAGIPVSTFNRYWNGTRSMTLGDVERTLEALGTTYSQEADEIRALIDAGE